MIVLLKRSLKRNKYTFFNPCVFVNEANLFANPGDTTIGDGLEQS